MFPLPNLLKRPFRWKLDKADWTLFNLHSTLDPSILSSMSPENATLYVTEQILRAAQQSIPQTSGNVPKKCKPWWNKECATTRADQNRAWGRFRRYPTSSNFVEFKRRKAKARWTRKQAKWKSWMKYLSSLTSFVPAKEAWDRYRKVNGDYRCFAIPTFNAPSSSLKDIGNILGEHFYNSSSSANYSVTFGQLKARAERQKLVMSGGNLASYNQPFTRCELEMALNVTKLSAPGPDGIHYEMLRHLSSDSLENLLLFFNLLWEKACFPQAWKHAHIIPLLKPNKDPSQPSSYRPIALTSCLGKTFERLINRRLVYMLESQRVLDNNQCGFRQGRSTLDHLVRLETVIREAFVNRQHCVAVFFDLERHMTQRGGMGFSETCMPVISGAVCCEA